MTGECFPWAADFLTTLKPFLAYIFCTIKEKPIEAFTLVIAVFALATWKNSLNADADMRLRGNILDVITDWETAIINACVATQPSKRKLDEQKAIDDASAIINNMSARLQKIKTLVICTIIGKEKETIILGDELQKAIDLNIEILEVIKTKWTVDPTKDHSADHIKLLFKNISDPKKSPSDLTLILFGRVPQTIESIARATDFLRPISCFKRLKTKLKAIKCPTS